jgi:hypothetical protein
MPRKSTQIELEQFEDRTAGVERSEPGGRAQLVAGGGAAGAGGRGRRELPGDLVEEALARARLRERGLPVERLPDECASSSPMS